MKLYEKLLLTAVQLDNSHALLSMSSFAPLCQEFTQSCCPVLQYSCHGILTADYPANVFTFIFYPQTLFCHCFFVLDFIFPL
jgi:hypothetical protein